MSEPEAVDVSAPMGVPAKMGVPAQMSVPTKVRKTPRDKTAVVPRRPADLRWLGIVEVLVSGLDGSVTWEPGFLVLQLPAQPDGDLEGDLDSLELCLGRVAVPVVFDASLVTFTDVALVEFLRKLARSGLMVEVGSPAA